MNISKIVCPLLKYRQLYLLEYKSVPAIIFSRGKNNKQNAITTSSRSELDTNVKYLGEKVKETTKTASYLGVILLGVAVTGTLFYAIFQELFSSKSPNNIYTEAYKKCIADPRVEDKLGLPITAYGEESRRGRRQHVSHVVYEKEGRKHLRMKFYLKGNFFKGTVHLEMAEVICIYIYKLNLYYKVYFVLERYRTLRISIFICND